MSELNIVTVPKPASNKRYLAVFMSALMITICYLDRVNFSVAAPTLMQEFNIDPGLMGVLMSAFLWSYTVVQMPVGGLLNKFGPKPIIMWASAGWGFATMITAACSSFATFFGARLLMGITESPAFSGAARVVSVWVPARERTFCSACFDCCARLGSAFAPPIVAWIIATWGWREAFIVTGAIAVVYAVIWKFVYHEPDDHPTVTPEELAYIRQDEVVSVEGKVEVEKVGMFNLFMIPNVMRLCIAYLLYVYVFTAFNQWMPTYLVKDRGLSITAMGFAAMYPYIVAVICELFGGWLCDKWQRRGASLNQVRRVWFGVGMIGAAFFIWLTMQATTATQAIIYLCCLWGVFSFGASNVWAVPQDIAPYGQAGGVSGVYSFIGQIGGIAAPIVTGYFVQSHFGFNGGFTACALASVAGALLYMTSSYNRIQLKGAA